MKRLTPILLLISLILALAGCSSSPEFYMVTFDTDGAVKTVESQQVRSGSRAVEPKDPVKDGTLFKEWTLGGEKYDFSTPVTGNITLKASYYRLYTVTYNTDGGSTIPSEKVIEGTVLKEPAKPVKAGTSGFMKWMEVRGESKDVYYYDFTEPVMGDLKLFAIYNNETMCTITFDSDGGTEVPTQVLNSGDTVIEPKDPTKENTYFKNWLKVVKDENGNESTSEYNFNEPVSESFTLRAVWKSCTVTYKNADGTVYKTEYVREGATAPQIAGPGKDGTWSFDRWVKDGTTTAYDFTAPVNEDLTLTATYLYRVKFDSDGGDYTPTAQFIKENGTVTEPKTPDKESTRGFMWWTTEDGNPYDFSSPVKASFTLKAVYWPANINSGGDYTIYDDKMSGIKNEVECMHYIFKKLVQNDKLMNMETGFASVFGTTSGYDNHTDGDALVFSILRNALLTPDTVPVNDSTVRPEKLASYKIDSECTIGSNTTEFTTYEFSESTKYTVNISGLKIKVTYNYDYHEYSEEADISIKGTFLKNSDERYELHLQMTVNGYEYPPLHAIATKSGDNGDDNVVFFNYKNFTSYCAGVSLW